MSTYTEEDWLKTPLGEYMLTLEKPLFHQSVADIFGFHAVQLGFPDLTLLENCRILHCWHASEHFGVDVQCNSVDLPFENHSIDLLLLPHTLEYSPDAHQTLREIARVLRPEGHIIISGFNPFSLWGVRKLYGRQYPWRGTWTTLPHLKDWLSLLGFQLVAGQMCGYLPPVNQSRWLQQLRILESLGNRWWPMLGSIYFLVAQKKMLNMRLIKSRWRKPVVTTVLLPKPLPGISETKPYEH